MTVKDNIEKLYYRIANLSIRKFWSNVGRGVSYFKVSRQIVDWDYSSILAVERHQIMRVRNSIALYHNHVFAERDIERMNLALRLLDIIEEGGCAEYHGEKMRFNEDNTLWLDPKGYYTMPMYVNTCNAKRFSEIKSNYYTDTKNGELYKSHLRAEKAWHIYHLLRLYFMRSWWD